MKKFLKPLYIALAAAFLACQTNDVIDQGPAVTLALSQPTITENGGIATITATLSASAQTSVTVTLRLSGTAVGNGGDFDISTTTIAIPAGNLTGTAVITALDDTLQNGNRTVVIEIDQVTGGRFAPQTLTLTIEDDDVPTVLNLIFNEVLYDPSNNALDGDANGDGVYAQAEDEFLEIINLSSQPADISGFKVYDASALTAGTPRHIFVAGTIIPPGKALVLFGGGTPTGSFGGAIVQTSTTGDLNMNNAGDKVHLHDASGVEVITFDINGLSANPNESYTRNPDITGSFEQHSDNTVLLFSPGTKIDGTPF